MSRQCVRSALWAISAAAALAGCSNTVTGNVRDDASTNAVITAAVGEEVDLTLRTFGPGPVYDSVPQISSSALGFVSEGYDTPQEPAGPTQLFRFTANKAGAALVTFTKPGGTSVTAKIEVR